MPATTRSRVLLPFVAVCLRAPRHAPPPALTSGCDLARWRVARPCRQKRGRGPGRAGSRPSCKPPLVARCLPSSAPARLRESAGFANRWCQRLGASRKGHQDGQSATITPTTGGVSAPCRTHKDSSGEFRAEGCLGCQRPRNQRQRECLPTVLHGVATQPVRLNPASTLVGRSRTMSSPGTPLRFPNSSARSGPM